MTSQATALHKDPEEAASLREDFEAWKKNPDRGWARRWSLVAVPVVIGLVLLAIPYKLMKPIPDIFLYPFMPLWLITDDNKFLEAALVPLGTFYALMLMGLIHFVAKRVFAPKRFQQTYCVKAFHNQLHFDYFVTGLTNDAVDLDTDIKRLLAIYKFHAGDAANARQQILELEDQINLHVYRTVKDRIWPHPFSLKLIYFDTDTTATRPHTDTTPRNIIILS